MRDFHINLWGDQRGTTAIEFAIVGPVFILFVIGILYSCMALFVVGSMHYAVEEGARCASVRTQVCSDNATTKAYTESRYFGPSTLPFFTSQFDAVKNCYSVSGTLNYVIDLGLKTITVPIRADACFP